MAQDDERDVDLDEDEVDEDEEAQKWLDEHKDQIPPEIDDEIDNKNVFSLEDLADKEEEEAEEEDNNVLEDNCDYDDDDE